MQVSFVIPVFNQLAHTKACAVALEAHVPASVEHQIIWVDDGSDAETKSFLATLEGLHRVVTLPGNQGFARATNAGAQAAKGRWLCLLNNDVEMTEGAIAEMLSVADSHRDAGIVGNVQITTATGEMDHVGISFVDGGYPLHRRESLEVLKDSPAARESLAVTAACCLVDRAWFLAAGGLDTRYRNGFEDVDLCLRAREAGWKIYVANHSVVKHAVSTSQGRGRYEYRNAQKFLERWGPRVKALQNWEDRLEARRHRVKRARASKSTASVVRAANEKIIRQETALQDELRKTATVWVDLLRMEPAGANGGIKPLVYGFLEEMTTLAWQPLKFVVLAQPGLLPELGFLRAIDVVALRADNGWNLVNSGQKAATEISQSLLESDHAPDVLYCPFGTSVFSRADLPSVALLVDSLHRDLPASLPLEEVNFREESFKRVIDSADWIQTLAQHGTARLQHHFGLHPTRCFHTYASVQNRLDSQPRTTERPDALPPADFFFYPANYWPHKNHEVLLAAYQHYRNSAGADAWPLLLTGHPDERMRALQQMSSALALDEKVTFAGHLPDDVFKSIWDYAGALVFPSLHEGFGIPLVEAFQAGVPVLAARNSVLPEVGHDACEWFDPRDPIDLAKTLARIADDTARREELSVKGRAQLPRFSRHYEASKLNHFLFSAARRFVP